MTRSTEARRPRLVSRGTVFRGSILAVAAVLLVLPAASYGGKSGAEKTKASSQLQVFSWWTGGGEANGLLEPCLRGTERSASARRRRHFFTLRLGEHRCQHDRVDAAL